jgi:nicotinate (nicotinamide) nucleotide adenylyltransferase
VERLDAEIWGSLCVCYITSPRLIILLPSHPACSPDALDEVLAGLHQRHSAGGTRRVRPVVLLGAGLERTYVASGTTPILREVAAALERHKAEVLVLATRAELDAEAAEAAVPLTTGGAPGHSGLASASRQPSTSPSSSSSLAASGVVLAAEEKLAELRLCPPSLDLHAGPSQAHIQRQLVASASTDLPSSSSSAVQSAATYVATGPPLVTGLPSRVLSCIQRYRLYSQYPPGAPPRPTDAYSSIREGIAGWYKRETLHEVTPSMLRSRGSVAGTVAAAAGTAAAGGGGGAGPTTVGVATASPSIISPTPSPRPRIGIFGGSFSPVTLGHVEIARQVAFSGAVDEVWIVPCGPRPDKPSLNVGALHRHAMTVLAVEATCRPGDPVRVVPLELWEGHALKSYDLLTALARAYPQADFSLIIGADLVPTLTSWGSAQRLLEEVHFVVVPRAGYDLDVPAAAAAAAASSTAAEPGAKRGREDGHEDTRAGAAAAAATATATATTAKVARTSDSGGVGGERTSAASAPVAGTRTVPDHAVYLTHAHGRPLVSTEVSSSKVRDRIAAAIEGVREGVRPDAGAGGASAGVAERAAVAAALRGLVADAVVTYICHHRLYFGDDARAGAAAVKVG